MNYWYVINTKPMSEDRVCKQFARWQDGKMARWQDCQNARSQDRGIAESYEFEVFCPKIKSASSEGIRLKPLFPSYVFLHWDLSDAAKHHVVKYTRGVNRVLGDGERAVPIAGEVVEVIKRRTTEGGVIEQHTFKAGDEVKVRKGHLRDLIGILERPVSDSGRVAVLLNLFNRQMRVQMRCSEIVRA